MSAVQNNLVDQCMEFGGWASQQSIITTSGCLLSSDRARTDRKDLEKPAILTQMSGKFSSMRVIKMTETVKAKSCWYSVKSGEVLIRLRWWDLSPGDVKCLVFVLWEEWSTLCHYKKSNSSIQTARHNIKGLLLSHRLLLGIQLLGPLSDGLYKVCMKFSLLFSSITPSQNCGGTNRI